MRTLPRRALTGLGALAVAVGGLAGVTSGPAVAGTGTSFAAAVAATSTPAVAASSSLGGTITRSEVIQRAQYWTDHSPGPYDQTAFSWDPTHSRTYRRDCSGFVDMAWHLNSDPNTHGLTAISIVISRNDLEAGDILDWDAGPNTTQGHVLIFNAWESDHVHFSYYSFGGGSGPSFSQHVSINAGTFDSHDNSLYVARRYTKITDDAQPTIGSQYLSYHGMAQFFARSSTGTLAHWYYSNGWKYENLGGDLAGTPTAYLYKSYDQLNVFGRTSAGYLHQWSYTPSGGWTNSDVPHDVVSSIVGDPAAYTYPVWEQQHIVARTASGQLLHVVWDPDNRWTTELLGSNIAGTPAVYLYTPWGQQQVVARTADSKMMLFTYSYKTGWTTSQLATDVTTDPAAYAYTDYGQQHIIAGAAGGRMTHWQYDYSTGFQRFDLGVNQAGAAAAYIIPAWDQQHVVYRSTTGELRTIVYTYGSGWKDSGLGIAATGDPAVLADPGTGQQHIYARTSRGWYHETLSES
jgi:hypothetical protein